MAKLNWLKEISRHDPLNLPALLWIGIGLLVFTVSYRLGPKFVLFRWIGLIFLVFGIFKLASWIITKKEVSIPERAVTNQAMGATKAHCQHCRRTIYSNQFYCHHCGTRLR